MEFEEPLITQVTRIADGLEKLNEVKDLTPSETLTNEAKVSSLQQGTLTDEQYQYFLQQEELTTGVISFSREQRNYINNQIKSRMLEVVKANEEKYNHADAYIEILVRWSKGDFSQAGEDHNAVWNFQEGTIGEAYRLLTPIEEWRYIEKHFVE